MYCKLFASLYQGTLRGKSHEILVFTNLLAHCDALGQVDKHFRAIAEETGLTIDEVKAAIDVLEAPDPESRSPDMDGARIIRVDAHRAWGWLVVNYEKYRSIRNEDDRREQNRLAQERWRAKNKPKRNQSKQNKPRSAQEEEEERHLHGDRPEISVLPDPPGPPIKGATKFNIRNGHPSKTSLPSPCTSTLFSGTRSRLPRTPDPKPSSCETSKTPRPPSAPHP